ncbi:MAG: iron-containing alcohol dehydrogenase [Lachnospiraceae bacterium]|nr:iron-containing alcohol dehydrogenase [Lachnospiraceae bacterium]
MKVWYRIRQWFMAVMIGIMTRQPKVIKGSGSLVKIADNLEKTGKKKVFIVTAPVFIEWGSLNGLLDALKAKGIEATVFSKVATEPTIELVTEAFGEYKKAGCEAIIAVGGGSVIDCSKAVGALAVSRKTIPQMRGVLRILKRLPDLYAVPTTAGTGSETTAAAVITDTIDGKHYKYAVNDFCLIPRYAVLDADLTLTVPAKITAATGMDALTHAVEAYTNDFASNMVKTRALDAVSLIYKNLPAVYENGQNVEARDNMLYAAFEAGIAFTTNFVGYVHAVAHAIGGLYGVLHGEACSIVLPYVMEQFGSKIYGRLAELADAAGVAGATEEEKAKNFIASIREMNEKMGIPSKVEKLKKEDFDEIISRAIKEANPLYPCPVIWNKKDFEILLNKLI